MSSGTLCYCSLLTLYRFRDHFLIETRPAGKRKTGFSVLYGITNAVTVPKICLCCILLSGMVAYSIMPRW